MTPRCPRDALRAPVLDVMNFLNEATTAYPDAISFAPGRPREELFDVAGGLAGIDRYVRHRAAEQGADPAAVLAQLGQYQRTRGVINDLVAGQLHVDEGIEVSPDAILMTAGAQEAMVIVLLGLFEPGRDVLLCSDPTYVGMTGPAAILGVETVGVASGPDGLEAAAVERAVQAVRQAGKVPRALYDIPDFNNPLGTTMPQPARLELLEVARAHDLLVVEDNPYRMFSYDGEPEPTLKALDRAGSVLHVGSFSKTVFPGLRLGFLVADQPWGPGGRPLSEELARVKAVLTVTASPLAQAVLGGILLEHGCSLRRRVLPGVRLYRASRDRMLERLALEFGRRGLADVVAWNRPGGGFFLTLTLPFAFDDGCFRQCAGEYGVVVCPMPFFALGPGRERQVRLSFLG